MLTYKIYQVKSDLTREFGYMGLSFLKKYSIEIDLNNYDLVYTGSIENTNLFTNTETPIEEVLERLFEIFNIKHPEDYRGRSLSVSDIIEIDNKYYYCDSFSWEEISI